jgi:hypothetical protein
MKRIKVIERLITEEGNFVELTHNSAEEGRVYRVEVEVDSLTWNEWYTSLDGELNRRLAREEFFELREKFFAGKVSAL